MTSDVKIVEISFKGSTDKLEIAVKIMSQLGFTQNEYIDWREAFPEMNRQQESGTVLREIRQLNELTQTQLAKLIRIPQRHISEMETAKRSIGKKMAKKFAQVLDVDYRLFL